MEITDIVLLLIVLGFGLVGLKAGLIHAVGSLLGTVFSFYLAIRYYEPVASWIISWTGWGDNIARVVVFIIAFLIIGRLVGIIFWLLQKIMHIVTWLPFVKTFNRLLGFVFGAIEGVVVLGVAIYFIERFPLSLSFMEGLARSEVAAMLSAVGGLMWVLAPEALKLLKSTVDYVEEIVL